MQPPRRILIVEDDAHTSSLLSDFLESQGYATSVMMNGLQVEPEVRRAEPALVLLDVTLPGIDGIEVCQQLRRFSAVPIIMVSGRDDEVDRLIGLEGGADDYVCKPFSAREIAARVKAQLRRAEGRLGAVGAASGFRVDDGGQCVAWEEQWLPLTPVEFRLMRKLLTRPGHVWTREELYEAPDDPVRSPSERAIDSHIKNLRRKIAMIRPRGSAIESVYGVGYRFNPDADDC